MTYKGLDVSNVPSYQRNITLATWKKIKAAGYSFVIIKAGGKIVHFRICWQRTRQEVY